MLLLGLTACSSGGGKEATTTTTSSEPTTITTTSSTGGSPGGVSGPQIWLRAEALSAPGRLSTWTDQTDNHRNATQPAAGRQPEVVEQGINGHPAVRFDGVDDGLAIAFDISPAGHPDLTIFTVFSSDTDAKELRKLYGNDDGGYDRAVGLDSRGTTNYVSFGGAVQPYFTLTAQATYVTSDVWTQNRFDGFVNGDERADGRSFVTGGQPTMALGGVRPDIAHSVEPWKGVIAEFIVYDRVLTAADRQRIETYLKTKYGVR